MREVWHTTFWTSSKTIDVHLGWLRRKIGDDPRRPHLITTLRGRGLRFEPATRRTRDRSPRRQGQAAPAGWPRVSACPSPAPILAVVGGGQLARMMAQPAVAMGLPLRLLAEADGVSAAQVIPDHTVGDYRDLDTLRAVTAGCAAVTFDHEHVPTAHLHALAADGLAVHPGPDALVHAQDKAVMRTRLTALGVPCPRHALVVTSRRSRRSASPACSRPPGAGTTARACGWCAPPRSAPSRSAPPPSRAWRCSPRSSSTSGASCRRWWPARRAVRRRRTRWWPRPSATASATRWSRPRPTSTPTSPRTPRRSRCASPGSSA